MPRIVSCPASARLVTPCSLRSNKSLPPAISPPPNSTSRISDSEDTDLPEPDSPTIQTVSPGLTEKETFSTPTTGPSLVWNSTLNSLISAIGWSSTRHPLFFFPLTLGRERFICQTLSELPSGQAEKNGAVLSLTFNRFVKKTPPAPPSSCQINSGGVAPWRDGGWPPKAKQSGPDQRGTSCVTPTDAARASPMSSDIGIYSPRRQSWAMSS